MVKVRVDNLGTVSRVYINGIEIKGLKALSLDHGVTEDKDGEKVLKRPLLHLEVVPDELRFDGFLDEDDIGFEIADGEESEELDLTPEEMKEHSVELDEKYKGDEN